MMATEKYIPGIKEDLSQYTYVYLIGIGGIGMSALARYFHRSGKTVCGYDKTKTPLTDELQSEGISVLYTDGEDTLPETFINHAESTLIIYTPAIPSDHEQLTFFTEAGYPVIKRARALGLITKNTPSLAVAGTHGKTTTSSILAHILHESGTKISAFLGGIALNFNSNFLHSENSAFTVLEADEYDRSFLQLHPHSAIITSTDADHLDIYGEKNALLESFMEFASQNQNTLIIHEDVAKDFTPFPHSIIYGESENCHYQLTKRTIRDGQVLLSIKTPHEVLENIPFPMPGKHNALNALAALAMGIEHGISSAKLALALGSFRGIKRRFQTICNTEKNVYIDDYAHHPSELKAAISATRELYPKEKITAIFQPHLYSRTADFMDEFASQLSQVDQLILLPIYPAREQPIPGITSAALLKRVTTECKLLTKPEALQYIERLKPRVLLTLGAGDIDNLIEPLNNLLS